MVVPRLSQSYPKFPNFFFSKSCVKVAREWRGVVLGAAKGGTRVSFIVVEDQCDLCWVGQIWIALRIPGGDNRY